MALENVIYLSDVRISFPNLAEPQVQTDTETGKPKHSYNCEFLMPPDNAGYQQFMQVYGRMAVEKWKEHAQTVMQLIHADRKQRCYGAGNEKINRKTFAVLDGYEGMIYLTAGNKVAPQMIQPDGVPVDPLNTMAYQAIARRIYGGCRVNAAVKPWLQDNKHGRGIRLDLCAVQFCRDDKAFGEGHVDAAPMFGAVAAPVAGSLPAPPAMPTAMPFPGAGMPGGFAPQQAPQAAPLPPFMQPR